MIMLEILFRVTCSTLLNCNEITACVCFCTQYVTDVFVLVTRLMHTIF